MLLGGSFPLPNVSEYFRREDFLPLVLEMPVPSQGHYGFHSFPVVTDFVCLYNYEF